MLHFSINECYFYQQKKCSIDRSCKYLIKKEFFLCLCYFLGQKKQK